MNLPDYSTFLLSYIYIRVLCEINSNFTLELTNNLKTI
jgi:hypothetical protein